MAVLRGFMRKNPPFQKNANPVRAKGVGKLPPPPPPPKR